MNYILVAGGLVFLFIGGEALVRGAVVTAERMGLSKLFVGLVIVGFGTSAPELVVCLEAALRDKPDIALGNVIGSNIANVLLILGVAAVIRPLATRLGFMKRDCAAMLLSSLVLLALGALGRITVAEGGVMLLGLAAFIGFSYITDLRRDSGAQEYIEHELEEMHSIKLSGGMAAGAVILGLVVLVAGSNMLISGATDIARYYGVPEAVIGLSLIAVGTSLPELATSVVAAYRNHADVAIGNVLGSNVFNILGMLGVTSLITAVPISSTMATIDIPVMLGSAVLLAAFLVVRWPLGRVLGLAMLVGYAAYLVAMYQGYTAV